MTDERTSHEDPEDLEVTDEEARDVKGGEGIVSPRDSASGQATGKRQHGEIKIIKQIDVSSPG